MHLMSKPQKNNVRAGWLLSPLSKMEGVKIHAFDVQNTKKKGVRSGWLLSLLSKMEGVKIHAFDVQTTRNV